MVDAPKEVAELARPLVASGVELDFDPTPLEAYPVFDKLSAEIGSIIPDDAKRLDPLIFVIAVSASNEAIEDTRDRIEILGQTGLDVDEVLKFIQFCEEYRD